MTTLGNGGRGTRDEGNGVGGALPNPIPHPPSCVPTGGPAGLARLFTDIEPFSRLLCRAHALRRYQLEPARAIIDSIVQQQGREFVVVFARQSGKDEMLAQLLAWLLARYQKRGGSVVVGLPAISTQGSVAAERLTDRLANPITRAAQRSGMTVELGRARVRYVSAAPLAQSRGQTASLLLVANECQDIDPDLWDARFAPMAAATNATRLYLGTVWSESGLLARQMRLVPSEQVYRVAWERVARDVPAYGHYVAGEIAKLGRSHPFIRTEYDLVPLEGDGGLFPPERRELMRGDFPQMERNHSEPGTRNSELTFAFTIDVAGEAEEQVEGEAVRSANPRKDSTALSVWRVIPRVRSGGRGTRDAEAYSEPGTRNSELPQNHYELVQRYEWTGTRHTDLYRRILALYRDVWKASHIVIDATGVGAGLASFLLGALGERQVTPFTFSLSSKSQLGWDFLGMIDSGRVKVHATDNELSRRFWRQTEATVYTILPGPNRLMRWSVPDPTVHDDLIVSAALVAALDHVSLDPRTAVGR